MLKVTNLSKSYDKFRLKDVSFSLEKGYIMGLIGRNGAGKSTCIKAMLNIVTADGGSVEFMGKDLWAFESECKREIGLVLGGMDFYASRRFGTIAQVTKRFYPTWDDAEYNRCLKRFNLDPTKKIKEYSQGMKVKAALTLALSHRAKLLILDEPTGGLDPVSRDELIGEFRRIIEDGEHSILLSTHITTDLDKCADYITYMKDGQVLTSMEADRLQEEYVLVSGERSKLSGMLEHELIGKRIHKFGFEGMVKRNSVAYDIAIRDGHETAPADLEAIMVHIERADGEDESFGGEIK